VTQNVETLGPCSSCGENSSRSSSANRGGAATILREARQLEREATCPECALETPGRSSATVPLPVPAPAAEEERSPAAALEATPVPPAADRPKRRINGESDPASLVHLLKVLASTRPGPRR